MIPNLISTILFIVLGTLSFIIAVFLPALLELSRPRDGGPRIIMEDVHVTLQRPLSIATIVNIEDENRFDRSLLPRLLKVIEVLPSLEA